jgi:hypothetical protein
MKSGYDSYSPDEALKQARERGEDIGWDGLFGVPGTRREGIWLAGLTVAVTYLASRTLFDVNPLWLALTIAGVTSFVATRAASWLVAPYADSAFRRLLWGLATAALLLLIVRVGLAVVLIVHLRLDRVSTDAAGVAAFHGAARFTLMIAMPVWLLYAIWGWLRRRSLPQTPAAPAWRRWLPIVLVLSTMIFLAREGAYFDSLPQPPAPRSKL